MKVYKYLTCPISVNTYLVYDDTKKGFIVDPGGYSQKLTEQAKRDGVSVEYLILTHGHGDHICGTEDFLRHFPAAKVVAFEGEKEMLEDPLNNFSVQICGRPISLRADIYVKDGERMCIGETEYTFIHTPGHTKGGMCILTKGAVFSGDTLFRESVGRTDLIGGSFSDLRNSIREKLFTLPEETEVYPGHMEKTSIGHEKRYNPFV